MYFFARIIIIILLNLHDANCLLNAILLHKVHVYTNLVSGIVHGGGHYDISRWKQKADQNKFIVVYPVGLGLIPAWNAG